MISFEIVDIPEKARATSDPSKYASWGNHLDTVNAITKILPTLPKGKAVRLTLPLPQVGSFRKRLVGMKVTTRYVASSEAFYVIPKGKK